MRMGRSLSSLTFVDHHVGVEQHLVVAEVGDAGRHHQVAVLERTDHVEQRQMACLEFLGVEVDQDGAVLAADHHGSDAPGHRAEEVADLDAGHVLDVGLVEVRVLDGENAQRHGAGRIERQHDRRQRVGRQGRQRAEGQLVGHGQGRRWDRCRRGSRHARR